MAHYDIFRDQLGIKYPAFGHALWEPNPGRLYSPVEVGDVGYIREGKFHRLFNALLPADHLSHQSFGVPEHYEPLRPSVANHIDGGMLSPNDFCSYGVTVASGGLDVFAREPVGSADVSFLCARKSGAVISLPVAAQREDTILRGDFAKWITKHIDSWLAFTRRLGLGIEQMEDIILVTGRHRTRSWTNIAFFEGQTTAQVSFGVQITDSVGTTSVDWQVSRTQNQGAMLSQGPSGRDLPEDQCIFVRGYRVTRAFKLFPRLKGAAGHTPDPSGPDCEPELEVVSIPSFTKYRDPLHVLLEYIAERAPDCDLVLVHDDDLDRLRRIGASDGTFLETLRADALVGFLQRSEPEIAQVAYDPLSSENNIPSSNTRGSMVAMFSEELSSWASASIRPEASTLSLVPVATQPASPRPQPRRQFQLQSQPFQLQPQPPADEAKKSLARELFLQKDRRPSPKRDAERDDFDRLFSTSSSLYSGMRALSLMSVASSQTRTSEYSSLFDSPPLLDPSVDPSSSSQTHDTLSSFNTSHEYNLTSRGRDYATVVVVSRAGNVLDPPQLHFGDQLKGCIVMHRDNLSDMRSMEVMFQLFESDPVTPSCEIKRTLSPQEVDESRISGGHFSWPFVITPPSVLSSIAAPASARTDPSITHHSSGDHFIRPRTQLMVIIYRTGGRLTRNVGLRQPIYYIPPPTPGTPSPPSQIPTSIPPDFPVDSWPEQKLPDVIMRGIIFRKLQVEVTCKLIVPVSHPVSDAIPLRLIMTCESREALDLLAISYAIDVRLLKVLAIGNNATSISPLTLRRPFSCHRTDWAAIAQWEANSHCSELPPSDEHPKTRWRVELNGMLHRNESVQITESFEQQGKALMYFVCLFPFKLADFRPAHDRNKELLMVKLPITK